MWGTPRTRCLPTDAQYETVRSCEERATSPHMHAEGAPVGQVMGDNSLRSAPPQPDDTSTTTEPDPAERGLPFLAVLGLLSGLLILGTAQTTLRDIDLYWHLVAGSELAAGTPVGSIGRDWSYASSTSPWISTQWLSEWALFYLHDWGGWAAMAAVRVTTFALVLGALALTTLRGRRVPPASGPFIVAGSAAWLVSQERPQQVTLVGAAVLGGVLIMGLTGKSLPRWWVALPLTVLWANMHGGWVLVPAVLAMISAGRVLDHGLRDRTARRALGLACAALALGAFSPAGLSNVTAAVRVSNAAAGVIAEWDPTAPISVGGSMTVAMLILIGLAWTRRGDAVPTLGGRRRPGAYPLLLERFAECRTCPATAGSFGRRALVLRIPPIRKRPRASVVSTARRNHRSFIHGHRPCFASW